MQYLSFILNLPWTILGLVLAIISLPEKAAVSTRPLAVTFNVRSFWWYSWLPGKKRVRAMTNGHIIQIGPLEQDKDLEHELVHVQQAIREPLIHPFLYALESRKHGYRNNKYEVEAYQLAGNKYTGEEDLV